MRWSKNTTPFLLVFLLLSSAVFSQTVDQKVEAAVGLINGIGGLFKKKKQADSLSNNKSGKTTNQSSEYSNVGSIINGGNVTNATKYIDCDELPYCFNYGILVIKKGDISALIDSGKFLFSYGQFDRIDYAGAGLVTVFKKSQTSKNDVELIVNSQGKVICDLNQLHQSGYYLNYDRLPYYLLATSNVKTKIDFLIDNKGNRFTIPPDKLSNGSLAYPVGLSENVIITKAKHNTQSAIYETYGAKTIDNKIVISPNMSSEGISFKPIFLDGFGVYQEIDVYKRPKFGITNNKGEKTCAAKFSSEPRNIGGGYFIAKGTMESEIAYAIINFKGDIIYKENKNNVKYNFNYYEDGYFMNNGEAQFIMDTAANIFSVEDFLLKAGLKNVDNPRVLVAKENATYYSFSSEEMQRKDGFLKFNYYSSVKRQHYSGFYNTSTKKIILGNFNSINNAYMGIFDPVSGLARVSQYSGKKSANGYGELFNEGFIDSTGNFIMLLKQEKSDF